MRQKMLQFPYISQSFTHLLNEMFSSGQAISKKDTAKMEGVQRWPMKCTERHGKIRSEESEKLRVNF